jgi:hypothetical protein
MKSSLFKAAIVIPMLLGTTSLMAAGPSEHSAKGSEHSIHGLAQTSVAGAKVTSGVVAVPLMIVGRIGETSGQAGKSLWDSATKPIGEPLEITDEIITSTVSPEQAMKNEGNE